MNTNPDYRTPVVIAHEPRGLPVRQVAYLRQNGLLEALITRQHFDGLGHLVAQWDPRLFEKVPNLTTVYRLPGEPVKVVSVDVGWRLSLAGVDGEILQRWDERGSHWSTTYDNQLRIVGAEESVQGTVETFTYADASADAEHNLRGRLIGQVDPSGVLELNSSACTASRCATAEPSADPAPSPVSGPTARSVRC